jgi:hypothetical protein
MGRGDIGRDNTSRLGERCLAVSATVALDGGLKDAATAPCRRCESSRGEAGRGDAGAAEARKGRGDDGSRRGDGAWPRGDSACTWSSVFEPLGIGEIIMESPLGRTAFVVVLVLVLVPLLVGLLLAGAGAAGAAKGSPLPLNKCHSGRRWLELGSRMRARSSFVITGGSAATRGRAVSGGPQRGQSSDTARGVGAISSFDTHIGDAMHAGRSGRVMDAWGGNTIEFRVAFSNESQVKSSRMYEVGAVAVVRVNMCSRVGVSITYIDRPAEAGCRGGPAVTIKCECVSQHQILSVS